MELNSTASRDVSKSGYRATETRKGDKFRYFDNGDTHITLVISHSNKYIPPFINNNGITILAFPSTPSDRIEAFICLAISNFGAKKEPHLLVFAPRQPTLLRKVETMYNESHTIVVVRN